MVGTLEKALKSKELHEAGELDEFDKLIVGEQTAQLRIPLHSQYLLRKEVDIIRGMCDRLEFLSHEDNRHPRSVLFEARSTIRATHRKLWALRGPGRPRKEG